VDTSTGEGLRASIEQVFQEWERFPGPLSHFDIVAVRDTAHDRYLLQEVSRPHGRQVSRTLAHLEIRDGKIWVQSDGTERGIATELVTAGVPKDKIVLAFYPLALREHGEFAVA
jgi:hypothetical protein